MSLARRTLLLPLSELRLCLRQRLGSDPLLESSLRRGRPTDLEAMWVQSGAEVLRLAGRCLAHHYRRYQVLHGRRRLGQPSAAARKHPT